MHNFFGRHNYLEDENRLNRLCSCLWFIAVWNLLKQFRVFHSLQNVITRAFNIKFRIPITFIQHRVRHPLKIPLHRTSPPGGVTLLSPLRSATVQHGHTSPALYMTCVHKHCPSGLWTPLNESFHFNWIRSVSLKATPAQHAGCICDGIRLYLTPSIKLMDNTGSIPGKGRKFLF
jgi:hypothetical protein